MKRYIRKGAEVDIKLGKTLNYRKGHVLRRRGRYAKVSWDNNMPSHPVSDWLHISHIKKR